MKEQTSGPLISELQISAYEIPTSSPEADGTFQWDRTTIVIVEASADDEIGLGYTYADLSTATLIQRTLRDVVLGESAFDVNARWHEMRRAVRNLGSRGIAAMAISAVDTALWDLKAKLLGLPLVSLFGQLHNAVPVYGSGGFTTYSNDQMQAQLEGWLGLGISRAKIKIGTHPGDDLRRVAFARGVIGPDTELFVDANGAFDVKTALRFAERFEEYNVRWFEEPVSSDDLEGLSFIREGAPAGMQIAAGEYGYDALYFRTMLDAEAVDVLQADATRCQGFSGFLEASTLCRVHNLPLSAHCAPTLHVPICAATPHLAHIEYFHDHSRIEAMIFDGAPNVEEGMLAPDLSRPGIGIELKRSNVARFAA